MAAVKLSPKAAAVFGVAVAPTRAAAPRRPVAEPDATYLDLASAAAAGHLRPRTTRNRGRTRGPKEGLNKLELAFQDEVLVPRRNAGEIDAFVYEGVKFKLGKRTFYTPDFVAFETAGDVVLYEVKGFWEEDARVKVKVAAYLYPFRFVAVTRGKAQRGEARWLYEDFS